MPQRSRPELRNQANPRADPALLLLTYGHTVRALSEVANTDLLAVPALWVTRVCKLGHGGIYQ